MKPFADKGIETIVSLFPWIGGMGKGSLGRHCHFDNTASHDGMTARLYADPYGMTVNVSL
jgi:hypothetical protein